MRINVLVFLVVLLSSVGWPSITYAGSASDAMNYISSGPKSLKTANRSVYTGGSLRMFVPQSTTQFVSITPPSYSAGCSGIDVAFGGFSFINGDQLKQMVKNIMGSAKGYALDLAIRTLCPICSDVMQKIRDVSNWANNLALDSCGAAKAAVDSIASTFMDPERPQDALFGSNPDSDYFRDSCKRASSASADWWDETVCAADSFDGQNSIITKFMTGISSGKTWQEMTAEESGAIEALTPTVNKTYAAMVGMGFSDKDMIELMMSVVGTSYVNDSGQTINLPGWASYPISPPSHGEKWTTTQNAASVLTYVLMFGKNAIAPNLSSITDPSIKQLMEDVTEEIGNIGLDFASLPFYTCTDAPTLTERPSDFLKCRGSNIVTNQKLGDIANNGNKYLENKGYLTWVAEQLVEGSDRMKKGQALTDTQLGIINAAPLPVYKMMKVAVIYPEAGKQLIVTYSRLIALMLIKEQFRGMIKPNKMTWTNWEGVAKFTEVIAATMQNMSHYIGTTSKGAIEAELQMSLQLQGILKTVDRLIAEKAIQSGAAGASMFSRRMAPSSLKNISN